MGEGHDAEHVFSIESVCDALGIDVAALRAQAGRGLEVKWRDLMHCADAGGGLTMTIRSPRWACGACMWWSRGNITVRARGSSGSASSKRD